jgi:hypothetical protein
MVLLKGATLVVVGLVATAALPASSWAEEITFKAKLSGTSEVPPTDGKGTGNVTATYDTASKKLAYTIDYSGLSGPATAAHFHGPAPAGQNGGVAVPVAPPLTSPIKGSATLDAAQANDLMAGKWYLNIHTAANKGGELRGQVEKAQ